MRRSRCAIRAGAVGPVFRAEPHDTSRHLAEYVSLDAELGFVRDHFDVMRVLREAVAGMCVDDVDLSPADERRLCEEHGSESLFVTGYPAAKRPFYTPVRHAAARRLRARPRSLGRPAHGRTEHP